jgi:archaellum biogenesis ATPase FlaH
MLGRETSPYTESDTDMTANSNKKEDPITDACSVTVDGDMNDFLSLEPANVNECISTGIDLLNLNLSSNINGGFRLGSVVQLCAEPNGGKSYFCYNLMRTAIRNPRFKEYKFRYIDKEGGCRFSGNEDEVNRIELYNASNSNISTIERAYSLIKSWLDTGEKQVIVLDSTNAFITENALDNVEANQKSILKEMDGGKSSDLKEDVLGQFAKASSKYLPIIKELVEKTDSLLLLCSQYRDKIGASLYEEKVQTSGGRALLHTCDYKLTFARGERIKKVAPSGNEYVTGYNIKIGVQKTRGNGLHLSCTIPFKEGGGVHQINALFEYLESMKAITTHGAYKQAPWMFGDKNVRASDIKNEWRKNREAWETAKQKAQEVWFLDQQFLMDNF